ncbi:MAG TPA: M28 family peptidase [Vicinamibacterales bacterium]
MSCRPPVVLCVVALFATACAPVPTGFSLDRARKHVRVLSETIGCRPVGSDANRQAREYIVDELRRDGFEVRLQEANASRPEYGLTTRVFNVIALRQGTSPDTVALISHYDSPPESVAAADDGLGVAVSLEAARVLAQRTNPRYTLLVAVTDAEEVGLMGAAALVEDPVMLRVRAYLNFEAVGTSGPSMLFQTGPGNAWLVKAWARASRRPGGASMSTEIYKRLPNDTDFTIVQRLGIPGLNFAPIGNSEAYHTHRDISANLGDDTILTTGENAVAIVRALDGVDITERSATEQATYFDIAGRAAVVYGPRTATTIAWAAFVLGGLAWLRVFVTARKTVGLIRVLMGVAWTIVGVVAAGAAMVGVTWLARFVSDTNHPWYSHPEHLFALLAGAGLLALWVLARLAAWLPRRAQGCMQPSCVWSIALPLWMAGTWWLNRVAPTASFMLAWPLIAAGVCLLVTPLTNRVASRAAAGVVLLVAVGTSLANAPALFHFVDPVFGRLGVVMPVWVFAAIALAFCIPVAPSLVALMCGRRAGTTRVEGCVLLLPVVVAFGSVVMSPPYSVERPQLRVARYINGGEGIEYWEVGGLEAERAPEPGPGGTWKSVQDAPRVGVPIFRLRRPYVYRIERPVVPTSPGFPGEVAATLEPRPDGGVMLRVRVVSSSSTATVSLWLPRGITPIRANPDGRDADGRWRAVFIAPPAGGVEFRVDLPAVTPGTLSDTHVAILDRGLPGGSGWEHLPAWLPQDAAAWTARSVYLQKLALGGTK